MASTLALCLQWRNGAGEKPGHILHNGESAAGPADSPNQHYCIIIAFLSLLLSPAFSIPLARSHSSHRVYLMGLWRATSHHYIYSITHTHVHTQSMPYCFSPFNLNTPSSHSDFFSSLTSPELFFLSLKNSDNDLPWKHTTAVHLC